MNIINYLSNITSIDAKYLLLLFRTIIMFIILDIIKYFGIKYFKEFNNSRKEYLYTQKLKIIINVSKGVIFLLIWSNYLSKFLTLITFISTAFTIALRDIIYNFFSSIYIRVAKPFIIEDRIEIDDIKGDVVNINNLSFEILEVGNEDMIGQSKGVITHIPSSKVFNKSLKNYTKGFKYVWDEVNVNVPLDFSMEKAKGVLYRIVNKNDVIKVIPDKLKHQLNNISTDYRIYYNQYNPTIYTKVEGDYVVYSIRYLVNPKKARYVNSSLWKHILLAYQNNEIQLYNKNVEYGKDI